MANTTLKIPGRSSTQHPAARFAKTTTKAVKKSSQYKTAKKAVDKTSTGAKAGVFLAIGAATAAGAYLIKRRGGGDDATATA